MQELIDRLLKINHDTEQVDTNAVDFYHSSISFWLWLTEEQYILVEKFVDKIHYNDWDIEIKFYYDVSWYSYWVTTQEEDNYIVGTVTIFNKDIDPKRIDEIENNLYCNIYNFIHHSPLLLPKDNNE